MDDEPLESIVIWTMEMLVDLLNSDSRFEKRKKEIQIKLEEYGELGNCGIVDFIYDAAFEISDDNK